MSTRSLCLPTCDKWPVVARPWPSIRARASERSIGIVWHSRAGSEMLIMIELIIMFVWRFLINKLFPAGARWRRRWRGDKFVFSKLASGHESQTD